MAKHLTDSNGVCLALAEGGLSIGRGGGGRREAAVAGKVDHPAARRHDGTLGEGAGGHRDGRGINPTDAAVATNAADTSLAEGEGDEGEEEQGVWGHGFEF